ncbi:MAG: class I SAM-dependent methyltransferase [Oscillatoria sp. SIO1A7]|nr:class I SAM-dependent methyltransferase [Oscillatoria sp. SIO1A7]
MKVRQCLNDQCKHKFAESPFLSEGGVMSYSESDKFSVLKQRNFQMIDYFLQQGYLRVGSKVLDLGSGEGHIARAFVERDFDVSCVEPSNSARKILDSYGLVNYPKITDIPSEVKYDLILLVEVIEHFNFPIDALNEAKSRLTDDGVIFVTTPCAESLKSRLKPEKAAAYMEQTHLHFFSSRSLEYCFQSAGFSKFQRYYLDWMIPNRSKAMKTIDRLLYPLDLNSHLTYFACNG